MVVWTIKNKECVVLGRQSFQKSPCLPVPCVSRTKIKASAKKCARPNFRAAVKRSLTKFTFLASISCALSSVNSFSPDMKMHIHLAVLYTFLMERSQENLSKYQDIVSLVITSFIRITWMFEQVVIMLKEISFSSLLGLKELRSLENLSSRLKWQLINLLPAEIYLDYLIKTSQPNQLMWSPLQ